MFSVLFVCVYRVCYTLNNDKSTGVRGSSRGSGGGGAHMNGNSSSGESAVISLRLAGDISLPPIHQRGLILPQSGPYPPTVIPLTTRHSNHRESGDYAASDIQSVW